MEVKIAFVDYSEIYYAETAKTAVPEKRSGKFVHIVKDDKEYFVFSPMEYTPYHADIVRRFCKDNGLKGSYNSRSRYFRISAPDWTIEGGGKFEIDAAKKVIRLYDNSMAYGRFDRRGMKDKVLAIRPLSAYKVVIE